MVPRNVAFLWQAIARGECFSGSLGETNCQFVSDAKICRAAKHVTRHVLEKETAAKARSLDAFSRNTSWQAFQKKNRSHHLDWPVDVSQIASFCLHWFLIG